MQYNYCAKFILMYNNIPTNATILIFTISILFFLVDLLNRKNSIDTNSMLYVFNRSIYTSIFSIVWVLAYLNEQYFESIKDIYQIIAFSLLCGFGLYLFILSNKYLKFTNILFVQLIGHILHQFIGYILFRESLNEFYLFSSALLIIGIFIQTSIPNQRKGFIYALLSTVSWTLGYSLMSTPLKSVSTPLSVMILELTIMFTFLILFKLTSYTKSSMILLKDKMPALVLIASITIVGSFLLNYLYKNYLISEIGYVNLLIMPIFIFLSLRINKEAFSKKELIANGFILTAYIISLL